MKKRFVVAIDGLTSQQSKQISDLFRGKYGWWHWIDGIWLVTDRSGTLNAAKIRDMIQTVRPTARQIVLEIGGPSGWAGHGPTGHGRDMFEWIRKSWRR